MKHYNQPETNVLQVNAQSMQMQTASPVGPVYTPVGQIGTMGKSNVEWDN